MGDEGAVARGFAAHEKAGHLEKEGKTKEAIALYKVRSCLCQSDRMGAINKRPIQENSNNSAELNRSTFHVCCSAAPRTRL